MQSDSWSFERVLEKSLHYLTSFNLLAVYDKEMTISSRYDDYYARHLLIFVMQFVYTVLK